MVKVWLREERFEAALPLGSRSVRPLSGSLVMEVVRALRAVDARTVQYATWVTEAWRTLQWGEQTARLLWEMLMLFSYNEEGFSGGQHVETWQCRASLPHLTLFLWLHLPDAFAKVHTHPSNYNIHWPPEASSSSSPGSATATLLSTSPAQPKGSSPPLHSSPPMHIPTSVHTHHGSPHSTSSHPLSLSTSPRSPRSYFQVQAWSKTEAHHVAFVKRHLRDMLASLLGLLPPASSSSELTPTSSSFTLSPSDLNLLDFLLSGGTDLTNEAPRLSDLAPFWQGSDGPDRCPVEAVLAWLDHVLCVNEVLYPPPPDPSAIQRQQQHQQQQHDTTALPPQQPPPRPIVLNCISHATVVRRDVELGARRRLYLNHCHDSHLYLLGPVQLACITGCTDCTIVVGAVAGLLRICNCERVTLIAACRRLVIHNCLESTFPVFVTTNPILAGDNRGCRLAPYNSCYPGLQNDLREAQLPTSSPPAINYWNAPLDLSSSGLALALPVTDEAASSSSPSSSPSAGATTTEGEGRLLSPDQFYMTAIPVPPPHERGGQPPQQPPQPLQNPFALPLEYSQVLRERSSGVERLQKGMLAALDETQQGQVETLVRVKFSEWLATSGNLRQVIDLIQMEGGGAGLLPNGQPQQAPPPPPPQQQQHGSGTGEAPERG